MFFAANFRILGSMALRIWPNPKAGTEKAAGSIRQHCPGAAVAAVEAAVLRLK